MQNYAQLELFPEVIDAVYTVHYTDGRHIVFSCTVTPQEVWFLKEAARLTPEMISLEHLQEDNLVYVTYHKAEPLPINGSVPF